jgi:hypothetical protein
MIWNQSIDSIQPNETNKSSTLGGVGLCKVRLELFDNENNTQFNILTSLIIKINLKQQHH